MNADFETATWAHHHGSVTATINKLIDTVATSLLALNRYEFDAPWRRERPRRHQA